ncbi:MAG: S8/S53 family peptidase [Moheibacter sp.]
MKKTLLLGIFLVGIMSTAQEKINRTELQKIATEAQKRYEDAKIYEENVLKPNNHIFPENVSFEGFDNLGIPFYLSDESNTQINSMNTDYLSDGSIPDVNATGSGMRAYIWDSGQIRDTHQEFSGRASNIDGGSTSLHATGVAGVLVGGGANANAKGIAHEANVIGYNYTNFVDEIIDESVNSENADYMISNHSYGSLVGWYQNTSTNTWYWYGYPHHSETESALFGFYTDVDAEIDEIAYNSPQHTMFKSAGNNRTEGPSTTVNHYAFTNTNTWEWITGINRPKDCVQTGGYDCISYSGSGAKNIILVGAVNPIGGDNRYEDPSDVVETWFTSFGPTDDGRIRPDVVAIGSAVLSARGDSNSDYYNWSGTSFSAPAAAGVGLLLEEVKFEADGTYLRSDMMKALLTHTANEAGDNLGPDYKFGYGLIDAFRAAQTILNTNTDSYTMNLVLSEGGSYTYEVKAIGGQPLKATIAWIDPAGESLGNVVLNDRTPMLVNDLDLRVTDGGTTYYPWKLNPDTPADAATQEDNMVDNVEQIYIENPIADQTYTITVNHKGTTLENGSQNYALVITGVDSPLATTELDKNNITVYPNPVVDKLNFQLNQTLTNTHVKVFNQMGQIVFNKKFDSLKSNQSVDFSSFPSGVYMVYIKSNEGTITKKVIKKF